jgi:hypothetical protein
MSSSNIGDDSIAIIGQHVNTPPISPTWHRADLPPALETLILQLLEKDPTKRPESTAVVLQALEAIGVDYIDESEVLTPADESYHIWKHDFKVPFVCGCRNLGEALRRIGEGAAMIRTKGEAGTGDVVEAVRVLARVCDDELIAGYLNRDGLRTGRGNRWTKERITSLEAELAEAKQVACDATVRAERAEGAMAILELLREWADGGMTVLVVTHGLDLAARFADHILLLARGRVAAEGAHRKASPGYLPPCNC